MGGRGLRQAQRLLRLQARCSPQQDGNMCSHKCLSPGLIQTQVSGATQPDSSRADPCRKRHLTPLGKRRGRGRQALRQVPRLQAPPGYVTAILLIRRKQLPKHSLS